MKVFSNLAVSLDGKIAPASREFFAIGSSHDIRLLRKLRGDSGGIVFGAEVLRTFHRPCLPLKRGKKIINAVLSTTLKDIDLNWPFFKSPEIQRIFYITGPVSAKRLKMFRCSSEVIKVSSKNPATDIVKDLKIRGLSRIGIEGGGAVMWEFVKDDLIQDYHVTVVPRIIGGRTSPTLVDGVGFNSFQTLNLKLVKSRKVGSELFLIYRSLHHKGEKHPLFK